MKMENSKHKFKDIWYYMFIKQEQTKGNLMDKTYEEMIRLVADRVYLGSDKDDFDNGELSGAAFVISRMFGKTIVSVKNDIKEIGN